MKIQPGDQAPDFTRQTHTGEEFRLSALRGQQPVVLFFYPRDNTPICTKEACAFRDAYEDFLQAGSAVVGISSGSLESHQGFAANQRLPYPLLSDADGSLRKLYGVPRTWGIFPGRVTYVIDREGVVRHVFNAQFQAEEHVRESLEVLRQFAGGSAE